MHSTPEAYYYCTLSVFLLPFLTYNIISGFLWPDSDGGSRINVCFLYLFGSALCSWFYDYMEIFFSLSLIFLCGVAYILLFCDGEFCWGFWCSCNDLAVVLLKLHVLFCL